MRAVYEAGVVCEGGMRLKLPNLGIKNSRALPKGVTAVWYDTVMLKCRFIELNNNKNVTSSFPPFFPGLLENKLILIHVVGKTTTGELAQP